MSGSTIFDHNGDVFVDKGYCDGHTEAYEAGDAADAKAQGANIFGVTFRRDGLYNQGSDAPGANKDGKYYSGSNSNIYWKDSSLAVYDAVIADINLAALHGRLRFDSNCGQFGAQNQPYADFCDPTVIFGRAGRNCWTHAPTRADYIAAIAFLVDRYCNPASPQYAEWMTSIEQMVEPRPFWKFPVSPDDKFTAADIRAFYDECDAAMKPAYPNLLYLRGGGEYVTNKIDQAWQAGLTQTALTANIFAFTNVGDNAAIIANWESRFNVVKSVRAARNIPVIISAFGTETGPTGGDPARDVFLGQTSRLKADGTVGALVWERKVAANNQNGYQAFYMTGDFDGVHTFVKKTERYDDITDWMTP